MIYQLYVLFLVNPTLYRLEEAVVLHFYQTTELRKQKLEVEILHDVELERILKKF